MHMSQIISLGVPLMILSLAVSDATAGGVGADRQRAVAGDPAVQVTARREGPHARFALARDGLEQAMAQSESIRIDGVPLAPGVSVSLELDRFRPRSADTQFVLGRNGGPDVPLQTSPHAALLLKGRALGRPDSFALLALTDSGGGGVIDLGGAGQRYCLSSRDANGLALSAGQFEVRGMPVAGGRLPGLPMCAVDALTNAAVEIPVDPPAAGGANSPDGPAPHGPNPVIHRNLRVIRLAVETDHEFYTLFNDATVAAAYVAALFGEVSDIYVRDVNARVDLTYVRIWDNWNDLFNQADPLNAFRSYWNSNMQQVPRDLAQFLSGRRDLPYGGVAWLSAICSTSGYSVVGYALGFFPDPASPSIYHYDIFVTAHELGHNTAAPHTHDVGVDDCFDLNTPAQRGTIMSYCSQTVSGGNAVSDLRFHAVSQTTMENYLGGLTCLAFDCNGNGIDDAADIQSAFSTDVNGNGLPDECEDCNNNGVLDPADITAGAADLNGNGVPDVCEPDCNGNGIPDAMDITGGSLDLHGDNIPDVCEPDCDNDGLSDYNEIMANMTLDINRDMILDACQDCDNDGTIDQVELNEAHSAWLAGFEGGVRAFHAATGVVSRTTNAAAVGHPNDVLVIPGGRILVTSADDHRVVEFDRSGALVGNFVPASSGGLNTPTGMTRRPNGNLLVSSGGTNSVLEYNGTTGAFVGVFVAAGAGGLVGPFGLAYGPNGNLFVTSSNGQVLEYNGGTGAFIGVFVPLARNCGLTQPRGLAFKQDGNLLVASFIGRKVLEFDGQTGDCVRRFNKTGTDVAVTLEGPWGIRVGADGQIYVSRHFHNGGQGGGGHDDHEHYDHNTGLDDHMIDYLHVNSTRIYQLDPRNGNFIRSYVTGNDTGLRFATGFDFLPGWDIDCNFNQRQDSCEIALGSSLDANNNGLPDECETDCNGNGVYDRLDIWPRGASLDCNFNGVPDECDIAQGLGSDCNNDGGLDECEVLTVIYDNFENDRGWTPTTLGATGGFWERGVPVNDPDWSNDPRFDADFGGQCWLTGNTLGDTGVNNGAVRLTSPVIDMSVGVITIEYNYLLRLGSSSGVDRMLVEINSNNGVGAWTQIALHSQNGGLEWLYHQIDQNDLAAAGVALTSTMRIRFTVNDDNPQGIVEAALDNFRVTAALRPTYLATGDMNCDCHVNGLDVQAFVLALLDPTGYATAHPGCNRLLGDLNADSAVTTADVPPFVALLLSQ